jgi:hypothetical protein
MVILKIHLHNRKISCNISVTTNIFHIFAGGFFDKNVSSGNKNIIEQKFFKGKAIILTDARQAGKQRFCTRLPPKKLPFLFLNCDEPEVRSVLTNTNW